MQSIRATHLGVTIIIHDCVGLGAMCHEGMDGAYVVRPVHGPVHLHTMTHQAVALQALQGYVREKSVDS